MTRPPPAVAVLQAALAAEHAVVFGYGVAGARLSGDARRRAQRGYDAHRARRDELAALLVERAAEPEPPAASYALPRPVEDARDAVELLTLLEERLAAVWADAVLELRGDLRGLATGGLRDAAVAAALWRRGSVPFPGLAERAQQ
ncbi:MAG TPA: ferritin-like domain-containing protein [Actinomycetes bacterium]